MLSYKKFPIFFIIFFLHHNALPEPWHAKESNELEYRIQELKQCKINFYFSSYPASLGKIFNRLDSINLDKQNINCKKKILFLKNLIKTKFEKSYSYISFQSQGDNYLLNTLDNRFYEDSSTSVGFSRNANKLSYRVNVRKVINENNNDYFFDESYLAFYHKGYVFELDRRTRWWSPSKETSLILSNSARPAPGIAFSSYNPIKINNKYIPNLENMDFEIFFKRLEKNRTISNAIFHGQRLSFSFNNGINLSLFRTAQFGGKDRKSDFATFIDILIGDDNETDGPGNQLAGLDFSYPISLRSRFYGQIVGEDESNFIPSKHFYFIGYEKEIDKGFLSSFSFEYQNIDPDGKDNIYRHYIYNDGYRYYKKPIGSNIDSDSESIILVGKKYFSDSLHMKLKLESHDININNKKDNYWSEPYKYLGFQLILDKKFKNNYELKFAFIQRKFLEVNFSDMERNKFIASVKYNF